MIKQTNNIFNKTKQQNSAQILDEKKKNSKNLGIWNVGFSSGYKTILLWGC